MLAGVLREFCELAQILRSVALGYPSVAVTDRFDQLLACCHDNSTPPMFHPRPPIRWVADLIRQRSHPGGKIEMLHCDVVQPYIRSGDLRALVVTSVKRVESLPDVPTAGEVGLDDLSAVTAWYGLYAPAETPKAIIGRIASALQVATQDLAVVARLAKLETAAFDLKHATPQALRDRLSTQV